MKAAPTKGENQAMDTALKNIGIVGAGQMGCGIAHVSAQAGYKVTIYDLSKDRIEAGLATINGNLARQVSNGKLSEEDRKATLGRISGTADINDMAGMDLVIEAATEDESVKRKIFAQLCPVLKPEALLATNTSSLSITRLAASTDRPERFMGIHFMNPVPVMKLVELVRGIATEEVTFATAREFVKSLDKTITVAEDFPAFIVNRILLPMINEAIYTLYEGVGSVEAIDTAMRLGANHPMGPLQLADFIGLDTCLSIMQVLHDGWQTASTVRVRCWSNMSRLAGSAANPAAASTTIAASIPSRRGKAARQSNSGAFACAGTARSPAQRATAASINALASALSHSAGPFIAPSRHPFSSISSVAGRPKAKPSFFIVLKTPIELSR